MKNKDHSVKNIPASVRARLLNIAKQIYGSKAKMLMNFIFLKGDSIGADKIDSIQILQSSIQR
ncbi:hypothetical protein [Fidelibacter multiformis]|uniref:hypothetical protein n=1 Tax=Fidelibacter multiformis TaxID=3377529 RepID=UPI0037DC5C3C